MRSASFTSQSHTGVATKFGLRQKNTIRAGDEAGKTFLPGLARSDMMDVEIGRKTAVLARIGDEDPRFAFSTARVSDCFLCRNSHAH